MAKETSQQKKNYRTGSASLYVVVFTTLLLAVTGGSFIRIVLRDTIGSVSFDNSQAALDAANIGLEMGKMALTKYHRCLTEGLTGTITTGDGEVDCSDVVYAMRQPDASSDCNIVTKILGDNYVVGSEVPIATNQNRETLGPDEIVGDYLDQAITCVLINEEEDDYRGALANSTPPQSKLVPLRTSSARPVTHVKVQWFTSADGGNTTFSPSAANVEASNKNVNKNKNTGLLVNADYNDRDQIVSPLYVQVLQAGTEFNLAEFYVNDNNGDLTDSAAVLFVPTRNSSAPAYVSKADFAKSNNKSPTNQPVPTKCDGSLSYYCSAIVELPEPIVGAGVTGRNIGASFLRVMIPYGNPYTQYSVTLCDGVNAARTDCNEPIRFTVQSSISSTGRAGDDFRRTETRVEMIDSQFPLPQYALNINGDIDKNFYVTRSHWGGADYGEAVDMSTEEDE